LSANFNNKAFTLIELIIVIVIVGILATLGFNEYTKTVEKGRSAEVRNNMGAMRKLLYDYYLKNGSVTGITQADLNIGSSLEQTPSSCRNTNYFAYFIYVGATNVELKAQRCTSGGKPPPGERYETMARINPGSGVINYYCWNGSAWEGPYTNWPDCTGFTW